MCIWRLLKENTVFRVRVLYYYDKSLLAHKLANVRFAICSHVGLQFAAICSHIFCLFCFIDYSRIKILFYANLIAYGCGSISKNSNNNNNNNIVVK
jgi:hypothetical protein